MVKNSRLPTLPQDPCNHGVASAGPRAERSPSRALQTLPRRAVRHHGPGLPAARGPRRGHGALVQRPLPFRSRVSAVRVLLISVCVASAVPASVGGHVWARATTEKPSRVLKYCTYKTLFAVAIYLHGGPANNHDNADNPNA